MKTFRIFFALSILVVVVSQTDILPAVWSNLIVGIFVAWILYKLIMRMWGNKE
jgi:hypothetical protein|tara:strand:+ start:560 stop:718 length:159 start_codon:yes stop_codon:yes gene_type:complete